MNYCAVADYFMGEGVVTNGNYMNHALKIPY